MLAPDESIISQSCMKKTFRFFSREINFESLRCFVVFTLFPIKIAIEKLMVMLKVVRLKLFIDYARLSEMDKRGGIIKKTQLEIVRRMLASI